VAHINSSEKNGIVIEVCCGSAEDVLAAATAGTHRVELNSALELGGLTPSIGALRIAVQNSDIKIISMLRPRGGGFCYSDKEFETMLLELDLLLENGSHGIAFGILTKDGELDDERCKIILDKMDKYGGKKEAVFHMAFDRSTTEEFEMLSRLDSLGFVRLLTTGRASSAELGADKLRRYIEFLENKRSGLEILPGGSIRLNNAPEIVKKTGAKELHGKCHKDMGDGAQTVDIAALKAYVEWSKSALSI